MSSDQLTPSLIQAAGSGDRSALDAVWDGLYRQLHDLAAAQMSRERSGHLLQTTAVMNEAWVRLSRTNRSEWKDRGSFLAAAANVMRRVLIDNSRRETAKRRGGSQTPLPLSETRLQFDDRTCDAIAVHESLERLAEFAPDQARAIELMTFGGMTGDEVAAALGVSPSTIDRRMRAAKAWLRRELADA